MVMVMDPSMPDQERELETFYMNFAQPSSLAIKQCLTLAIQVVKEGSFGLGGWQGALFASWPCALVFLTASCSLTLSYHATALAAGLQGKLSKLTSGFVAINPASVQAGMQVR